MKIKSLRIAIASSFLLVGGCSKDAATPTVPKPSSQQTQTYDPITDTTTIKKDGFTSFAKGSGFTNSKGEVWSYVGKPTNGTAVKQATP
jgi:PBP1b-binding outer membrane lipoprotein LpoB